MWKYIDNFKSTSKSTDISSNLNKLWGQIFVYIHLCQMQHKSLSIKNFDLAIFIPKYMFKTTSCNVIYAAEVLALWTK